MNFKETYENKKVFLTGHTGFKGCWLLGWLHMLGAHVKGYALAPQPEHQLYQHIRGDEHCDSEFGDIMQYDQLEKSLLDFQPDFVFHLAAQAIVRQSYQDPVGTFSINSIGTAHVLNAIRKLEKPCIAVLITTDKVYYNYEWPYPYRETDRLGGYDPYSASKACAELVIDSFRNSFFNRHAYPDHQKSVAVARAGNVIGGGDWAKDRIIPDIIRSLQAGESIPVRNPRAVRPWQHVLEPLGAYLLLGAKQLEDPVKYASEYNFGPLTPDCWQVEDMVKQAIQTWGGGNYHVPDNTGMPHEAGLLKLDVSKAERDLHWKPRFSASEAIDKTISWYKSFDGSNAWELIRQDIHAFTASVQP
ncbi:MAG: CDP-glucose 4,6-dehydratase [Williamsia sp.]|nr:CDP-glucose 4,6-dehydratase [Williamsia sp.]